MILCRLERQSTWLKGDPGPDQSVLRGLRPFIASRVNTLALALAPGDDGATTPEHCTCTHAVRKACSLPGSRDRTSIASFFSPTLRVLSHLRHPSTHTPTPTLISSLAYLTLKSCDSPSTLSPLLSVSRSSHRVRPSPSLPRSCPIVDRHALTRSLLCVIIRHPGHARFRETRPPISRTRRELCAHSKESAFHPQEGSRH